MGHLRVPVRHVRRRSLGYPQHPPWGAVEGQTKLPGTGCLWHQCWPCCQGRFQTRHGIQGSLAVMFSCFLCRCPEEHRRVKSPCSFGSRHRHTTLVPARHHHCDDCSPRGNDRCGGRRLASAPEEKAHSGVRTPCPHCHDQRTPCTASNSRKTIPSRGKSRRVRVRRKPG
jgi:hypothetical protein